MHSAGLRVILGIFALSLPGTAAHPAAAAQPDAYDIFARARYAWHAQEYPPEMSYVVVVNVVENGVLKTRHYSAQYSSRTDHVSPEAFSREEQLHPYKPHGFGITFQGIAVGSKDEVIDYLGVPVLAPTYTFGIAPFVAPKKKTDKELIAEIRAQYPTPNSTPSILREIGRVVTPNHDYRMKYAGEETVEGSDVYHITLQAIHDPKKYRLRELWVNTGSYATKQLISDGNFTAGPPVDVRWLVKFKSIAGLQYIGSESSQSVLRYPRSRSYSSATVSFEEITAVKTPLFGSYFAPSIDVLHEPG